MAASVVTIGDLEETATGFAALDAAVATEHPPQPVEEDCDLLVTPAVRPDQENELRAMSDLA